MIKIRSMADLISVDPDGTKLQYDFFWGVTDFNKKPNKLGCFSQWSPHTVDVYSCMEQYMMVNKALMFRDIKKADELLDIKKPIDMKAKINNFDKVRWDNNIFGLLEAGNFLKFTQHNDIKDILLSTGDNILVAASTYDEELGIGTYAERAKLLTPSGWVGKNILGFVLMEVRDIIRQTVYD